MAGCPIFYINLDSRPDRRAFMEQQFRELGLTAVRIAAASGAEAGLARQGDPRISARFTDVEVACNLSHRKAWQAILDSGAPAGIVLEDDAVLGQGFGLVLDWDSYAPLDPRIVRLETFLRPVRRGTRSVAPAPGFLARPMISSEPGSAGYIISRDAARQALADPSSLRMLVDAYLFGGRGPFLNAGQVAQLSPGPCVQAFKLEGFDTLLAASDLRAARQPRYRADGPYKARPMQKLRRQLAIVGWLIRDPAVLFGRPEVAAFSGGLTRPQPIEEEARR